MHATGIANERGFRKIVQWLQSVVDALLVKQDQHEAVSSDGAEFDTARASRLFVQALHESSNLEMDWIWYAANMTHDVERRYCLKRALDINPSSDLARRALAKLPPQSKPVGEITVPASMAAPSNSA